MEPCTRGDPESALRWSCKSLRVLAAELTRKGHEVSYQTVRRLLKRLNYSLQGNRKTLEGTQHADRDAQFQYINAQTKRRIKANNPAISVDTKKKELVGDYKNGGREYRPKGEPEKVDVHDFKGELGRVSPYGVYDLHDNSGWVSVGGRKRPSPHRLHSRPRRSATRACHFLGLFPRNRGTLADRPLKPPLMSEKVQVKRQQSGMSE